MKKHLIILLSIITIHAHAMETENSTNVIIPINLKKYPIDILDHIAQYLPFHDCEFEEEFVERTKALKTLTVKEIPQEYVAQLPFTNIKCCAYSPNNALIAVLQDKHTWHGEKACKSAPSPQLVIINRKDNTQTIHRIGKWNTNFSELAISHDGNWVATIHTERDDSRLNSRIERLFYKDVLTIMNLSTNTVETLDSDSRTTIAFNKQGTHIILNHPICYRNIIPVTVNTPDPQVDYIKTFAKYCAQRGICKQLIAPITEKK